VSDSNDHARAVFKTDWEIRAPSTAKVRRGEHRAVAGGNNPKSGEAVRGRRDRPRKVPVHVLQTQFLGTCCENPLKVRRVAVRLARRDDRGDLIVFQPPEFQTGESSA